MYLYGPPKLIKDRDGHLDVLAGRLAAAFKIPALNYYV